ncbi:MAG: hypothetical protein IJ007_08955, partial [Oscillospiraceae bacterium]|nr:hypothetical protein [Oscillospiraceae bacterium]
MSELNKKKGCRIALVSGGADSAYHSVIATELVSECKKYGHKIIWFQSVCTDAYTGRPYEIGEMNIYNLINYELFDVVVLLAITFKEEDRKDKIAAAAKKAGVPVIAVDKEVQGAYTIKMDYEDGLEDIIRHVIEVHKAKTFAFLTGMKGQDISDAREQKFRTILGEYGIPVDDSKIEQAWFWHEGA